MKGKKAIIKESKDGTVQKLKNRIRKLEKENKQLKSDLNSYEQAFRKTTKFLKDNTADISIEKLIESAKSNKTLKNTQEEYIEENRCPECGCVTRKIDFRGGSVIICTDDLCGYRKTKKVVNG